MNNKKKYIFRIVLAAILLGLIFIFREQIKQVNYYYLILAVCVYSIVIFLRSLKLNRIFNVFSEINMKETFHLTASSQLMGAFIPGRAGEVLVSAYLKLKYNLDISKVLPILFLDKLIELVCVSLYSIISIVFVGMELNIFDDISVSGVFKLVSIIVLVFILICLAIFVLRKRIWGKLSVIVQNVRKSLLVPLEKPRLGIAIVIFSLIAIILEYLYLFLVFRAFNITISLPQVIVVHSIGMIVGVVSMIPGGQGSTEVAMLATLHLWGYTAINVLSPILASKVITYIVLTVYALPLLPYSIKIIKERKSTKVKVKNE